MQVRCSVSLIGAVWSPLGKRTRDGGVESLTVAPWLQFRQCITVHALADLPSSWLGGGGTG